jgi:hypothetical protein
MQSQLKSGAALDLSTGSNREPAQNAANRLFPSHSAFDF